MFKLYIKPTSDNQIIHEYYKNTTTFSDDSGVDLFCLEDMTVEGGEKAATIKFGICCSLYKTTSGYRSSETRSSGYMLVPRSSISKTPLRMSNSIGIIDAGYRGEIMAKVDNISDHYWNISKGDRLFQLISPDMSPMNIVLVDELDETDRGEGGFGSTGK